MGGVIPLNADQWRAVTGDYSATEKGCYLELLLSQWETGAIPGEVDAMRLCGVDDLDQWAQIWRKIAGNFQPGPDGLFRNPEIEAARQRLERRNAARRENGKKGGRPKAKKPTRLAEKPSRLSAKKPTRLLEKPARFPASSNGTGADHAPQTDVVLQFRVIGTDQLWGLTQSHVDEWSELYPAIDVLETCKRARQWLTANPRRRKTPQGMIRFLVTWLGKDHDRATRARLKPAKPDLYGGLLKTPK